MHNQVLKIMKIYNGIPFLVPLRIIKIDPWCVITTLLLGIPQSVSTYLWAPRRCHITTPPTEGLNRRGRGVRHPRSGAASRRGAWRGGGWGPRIVGSGHPAPWRWGTPVVGAVMWLRLGAHKSVYTACGIPSNNMVITHQWLILIILNGTNNRIPLLIFIILSTCLWNLSISY